MRFVLRFLTRIFLNLAFLLLVSIAAVDFVVTDKNTIKESLSESDFYETIVPAVIDAVNEQTDEVSEDAVLSFQDDEVRRIFEDSVTPQIVQTQFESFLDDIFPWIEGQQANLTFDIDLREIKTNLVSNTTDYLFEKVSSQPPCNVDNGADSLFETTCQPPGLNRVVVEDEVTRGFEEVELLSTPRITQDSFVGDSNTTLSEQLDGVRNVRDGITLALYVSGGVFSLMVVLFVLVRRPLSNGVSKLGKNFLFIGGSWAVFALIGKSLLPGRIQDAAQSEGDLAVVGASFGEVFVGNVLWFVFVFTAAVAVLGAALIVVSKLLPHGRSGKKHKKRRRLLPFRRRRDE